MLQEVNLGWKRVESILNKLIRGANSQIPITGDGLTFQQTPRGVIISRIRDDSSFPPISPPKNLPHFITLPLFSNIEGQSSIETNQKPPGPDVGNPLAYYPFALPSGSYNIQFLDNSFNPIGSGSQYSISASSGTVSNLTTTSVSDPFTLPPGQRIYSYNWELTINYSPLTAIPGNLQMGRFFFAQGIPQGAIYAVVGTPGNNVYPARAINLGQFVIHSASDIGTGGSGI